MAFVEELIKAQSYLTFDHQFIDPALPTGLWFCCATEDVQAAGVNAVMLAVGADWGDLRRCERFLQAFPYVFVAIPPGKAQEEAVARLQEILPGLTLYIPARNAFRACRNVREYREQYGLTRLTELLINARELPVYGLINMADIQPEDQSATPRVRSGFPELDRFTGGFYAGQLSLWTGERGLGKSTILGQILLEAVDQGRVVCAYSGELDKGQFKNWLSIQAAGPDHAGVFQDPETGRKQAAISAPVQRRIDEWWDGKFYLYDIGAASSHSEDTILTTFENAGRCYGASVYLVDNVMTIDLKRTREAEYFRAQSNFAGRLTQFAKQHGAHVHLVAHPRKADKQRRHLIADDVGGSGDLPNRADNVFALERDQITLRGDTLDVTVIHCLKNRKFGGTKRVNLQFDVKSKRFYPPDGSPNKLFGWDTSGLQTTLDEIPEASDMPF